MSKKLEHALEAAGWKSGEVGDFLGMTDEERTLLEAARMEFAAAEASSVTLPARAVAGARSTPGST